MNRSEAIDELAKALAAAQGSFPDIQPDATGQVGGGRDKVTGELRDGRRYKYASLAQLIKACRSPLAANGLSVSQAPDPAPGWSSVRVITTLLHASGQWLQTTIELPLANATPQGYGSALTYARRYAYQAMLGITGEDDDDGHEAGQRQSTQTANRAASRGAGGLSGARQQASQSSSSRPSDGAMAQSPGTATSGAGPAVESAPAAGQPAPATVWTPEQIEAFEQLAIGEANPLAKQYLDEQAAAKGYPDRKAIAAALTEAGLEVKTTPIGAAIKALADLTAQPATTEVVAQLLAAKCRELGITATDIEFYGNDVDMAIAAAERSQQEARSN